MDPLQRLKSAAFFSALGFFINAAIVLAWYLFLSWKYSPIESGRLLLAISSAALISLVDVGISVYLTGKLATLYHEKDFVKCRRVALDAIAMLTVLSTVVALCAAATLKYFGITSDLTTEVLVAFVVLAVCIEANTLSASIFKGLHRFKLLAICQTVSSLVPYGSSASLIFLDSRVETIFVAFAGASALSTVMVLGCAIHLCSSVVGSRCKLDPTSHDGVFLRWRDLMRGGLLFFPQQLPGLFFNHALRFLVAMVSGIQFVTAVSLAFTIASRMHALFNSALDAIYPMAKSLDDHRITAIEVERFLWRRAFPLFLLAVAAITVAAHNSLAVDPSLILLFCAGTWVALLSAPTFHLANASGGGGLISAFSILTIAVFLGLLLTFSGVLGRSSQLFGFSYVITQLAFLTTLKWAFKYRRPKVTRS